MRQKSSECSLISAVKQRKDPLSANRPNSKEIRDRRQQLTDPIRLQSKLSAPGQLPGCVSRISWLRNCQQPLDRSAGPKWDSSGSRRHWWKKIEIMERTHTKSWNTSFVFHKNSVITCRGKEFLETCGLSRAVVLPIVGDLE